MMADEQWAIGVDVGGTNIVAALISQSGRIHRRLKQPTNANGEVEAVERQLVETIKELQNTSEAFDPKGVGVGVAGQVENREGRVRMAPNLDWRDVPLRSDLEEYLGLPIIVTNDVRAATWGEWLHGAGKDCDDLVCLFVGTGVGGGVVSGGRMLTGSSNAAGELGHITVDLHGPPCSCRNRGCLEALAGGWAIAQRAQETIAADPAAGQNLLQIADGDPAEVTAETVAQGFHEDDPVAQEIVDQVGHALGAGTVTLINAFNPQRLILGGGVIEGLPELVTCVNDHLDEHALRTALVGLEVLPATLKSDAGVIGASALVHQSAVRKRAGSCAVA